MVMKEHATHQLHLSWDVLDNKKGNKPYHYTTTDFSILETTLSSGNSAPVVLDYFT